MAKIDFDNYSSELKKKITGLKLCSFAFTCLNVIPLILSITIYPSIISALQSGNAQAIAVIILLPLYVIVAGVCALLSIISLIFDIVLFIKFKYFKALPITLLVINIVLIILLVISILILLIR